MEHRSTHHHFCCVCQRKPPRSAPAGASVSAVQWIIPGVSGWKAQLSSARSSSQTSARATPALGKERLRRTSKGLSAARHFHRGWASAVHPANGRVPALSPVEYPAAAAQASAARDRVQRERSTLRAPNMSAPVHCGAAKSLGTTRLRRHHLGGATPNSPIGRMPVRSFRYRLRRPADRIGKRGDGRYVPFFRKVFAADQTKPSALREISRFSQ